MAIRLKSRSSTRNYLWNPNRTKIDNQIWPAGNPNRWRFNMGPLIALAYIPGKSLYMGRGWYRIGSCQLTVGLVVYCSQQIYSSLYHHSILQGVDDCTSGFSPRLRLSRDNSYKTNLAWITSKLMYPKSNCIMIYINFGVVLAKVVLYDWLMIMLYLSVK